ncbi:thiol-disulfide oxidoreductase DCC family protein [Mycobacterium botniense]|uniref:Thiol-disulfide oxidoreductase n=1 Tax=Mycobacterium botniense TaxID=84962 RepID=A0A7I9Y1I0_9MYCO|nr:DUF393 domain-containing protein [Mycobacterium botniense]GFG75870.1 hypothetical protein MBOT_32350 [Mycobacterium botniense]
MNAPAMIGTLFFDGDCGICTRARNFLLRLNRTGNLQTKPLQARGVAEQLGIPPSRLLESARWLDPSGAVYSGAEAANAALSAALGIRVPLIVYRFPGVRWIEDAIYHWVATHRDRLPGTTPYCQAHPDEC